MDPLQPHQRLDVDQPHAQVVRILVERRLRLARRVLVLVGLEVEGRELAARGQARRVQLQRLLELAAREIVLLLRQVGGAEQHVRGRVGLLVDHPPQARRGLGVLAVEQIELPLGEETHHALRVLLQDFLDDRPRLGRRRRGLALHLDRELRPAQPRSLALGIDLEGAIHVGQRLVVGVRAPVVVGQHEQRVDRIGLGRDARLEHLLGLVRLAGQVVEPGQGEQHVAVGGRVVARLQERLLGFVVLPLVHVEVRQEQPRRRAVLGGLGDGDRRLHLLQRLFVLPDDREEARQAGVVRRRRLRRDQLAQRFLGAGDVALAAERLGLERERALVLRVDLERGVDVLDQRVDVALHGLHAAAQQERLDVLRVLLEQHLDVLQRAVVVARDEQDLGQLEPPLVVLRGEPRGLLVLPERLAVLLHVPEGLGHLVVRLAVVRGELQEVFQSDLGLAPFLLVEVLGGGLALLRDAGLARRAAGQADQHEHADQGSRSHPGTPPINQSSGKL